MAKVRLRASGTWNGSEVWNFGLHVDTQRSIGDAAAAWAAALTEAWSGAGTPAGALQTLYNPDVVMTEATAAEILLVSGKQQGKSAVVLNLPGTSAEEQLPPQCAVVVSTRTLVFNKAGRGRFYLPAMAANAIEGGRIATAAQTVVVNAAERLFTALKAAQMQPVLWAQGATTGTPITSFNVGDVMDTQRRRRNQLSEVRVSRNI